MMSNSNKPSAFKAKPTHQQTPAGDQTSGRVAARRPAEGTAAQRQAQQRAVAQRQAQQQAAAQRQAQQQAAAQHQAQQQAAAQRQAQQRTAAQRKALQQAAAQRQAQQQAAAQRQAQQRRSQPQVSAQYQVQQAAAQQRARQQATAAQTTQKTTQNRTRTQQPRATAQRPAQQPAVTQRRAPAQAPAQRQAQQPVATQRRASAQAPAQRPAQQPVATQRRAPAQASAQRPAQQPVATQRRAPAQAPAQRQAQQPAATQRRASAQASAQRPAQQPAATQRRASAQAPAQRPAQQPAATQRRAPAQASAQRQAQQPVATQRRAPAQAPAQRPAQQPAATQRRAPAQAPAQRPAQQPVATQRRAPAQAPAQRPAQQPATAQKSLTQRVTKAQAQPVQKAAASKKASATYAQRQAQASVARKRLQQDQTLTRQGKKAAKVTAKGKKRSNPVKQSKAAAATAITQTKQPTDKSPVKKQRGPKQPLPPTLKGKIQYGFQQLGPTVAEIQEDPYKKAIATRVIIIVLALVLSIRLTSVINDILGFGRSTDSVTFTISEDNMTTNKVIGQLDRNGIIKHSVECKVFIALTDSMRSEDYTKATYLKGDYVLSKNMGIEKMLLQCMNIQRQETVEVSVPEGYNVVQIGEALEKNKVCSQEDFLKACSKTDYDFDFLQNMENADTRYAALEGYLYPDTYEFYVGQDAESVVKKMLSNFQSKWTDEYEARAEEINMTMDQVLTMASIVQKEDSKASNMAYISSVFYNRLNSSNFPTLQSDATVNYVKEYIKPHVTETEYNTYLDLYSTYNCKGLPVGAICNPGNDAIKAVLWPQTTSYYFFAHDDDGNIYLARTANEQNANVNKAAKSSSSDDS